MKLYKCIKYHTNYDHVGISFIGEKPKFYQVLELKTDHSYLLNYKVLNIHAEITKLVISLNETPVVIYTVDL